jgi:dihydroorotate dehydrogenase
MPNLYPIAKPILMSLEAERAHGLTIAALKAGLGGFAKGAALKDPALAVNFLGRDLPNPIGLAAGFDKNAELPGAILRLGFGFTEVGTITPRPQDGNPKPRLFRLAEDEGVINRMGFNSAGSEAVASRLAQTKPGIAGMVGVNIGANKDSEDFIADYEIGLRRFDGLADYFVINISSPNTPGLRDLQGRAAFAELLGRIATARAKLQQPDTPLLIKIAPDLSPGDHEDICEEVLGSTDCLQHHPVAAREFAKCQQDGSWRPVRPAADAAINPEAGQNISADQRAGPVGGCRWHYGWAGCLGQNLRWSQRCAGLFRACLRRASYGRPYK